MEVELNGKTFARGVSPTSMVVRAYEQTVIRVETISNTPEIVRQFRDLARLGDLKIHYRLKGQLQPRGRPDTVPFYDKGVISLKDLGP